MNLHFVTLKIDCTLKQLLHWIYRHLLEFKYLCAKIVLKLTIQTDNDWIRSAEPGGIPTMREEERKLCKCHFINSNGMNKKKEFDL